MNTDVAHVKLEPRNVMLNDRGFPANIVDFHAVESSPNYNDSSRDARFLQSINGPMHLDLSNSHIPPLYEIQTGSHNNFDKFDFYANEHSMTDSISDVSRALGNSLPSESAEFTRTEARGVKKEGFNGQSDSSDISTSKPYSPPKPSEALFVRTLITRCKRIAPLWFRSVSSMRERNREENRRMMNNSGQSQSDWSAISLKIAQMDAAAETDAVTNLLKKLYKELPAESVLWFLQCWLGSDESIRDPYSCVLSRGDAKCRMRRIDGGKGSDKVWRLDTIVGMLYHGLPMSSTDTNIMVHTCDHELCVRPQHIRFRASSVALVVVLKALDQAGYTVIPPPVPAGPTGVAANASDESVNVFGPFTIDELQRYRSENINITEEMSGKLALSASDREFAESISVIRAALTTDTNAGCVPMTTAGIRPCVIPQTNGFHPGISQPNDFNFLLTNKTSSTTTMACKPTNNQDPPNDTTECSSLAPKHTGHLPTLGDPPSVYERAASDSSSSPKSNTACFMTSVNASRPLPPHARPERRSLKRPAPMDSPHSFTSSPAQILQQRQLIIPPNSSSPPCLIPDDSFKPCASSAHLLSTSVFRPNPLTCLTPGDIPSYNNCIHPTTNHYRPNIMDSFQLQPPSQQPINFSGYLPHLDAPRLFPNPHSPGMIHQPFPIHHQPSSSLSQASSCGHTYWPMGSSSSQAQQLTVGQQLLMNALGGSNSGKCTPRQPAKKRLEARTPTIDSNEGGGSGGVSTASNTPTLNHGTSALDEPCAVTSFSSSTANSVPFRVHQNTPFVPVRSRSGRPSSSGSSSSNGGGTGTTFVPIVSCNGLAANHLHPIHCNSNNFDGAPPRSTATTITVDTDGMDEEEEELRDIMILKAGGSILHTPAGGQSTESSTLHHRAGQSNTLSSINKTPNAYPKVGWSPSHDRRVIQQIGALFARAYTSPVIDSTTPPNPRRSVSVSDLPYTGSQQPNENGVAGAAATHSTTINQNVSLGRRSRPSGSYFHSLTPPPSRGPVGGGGGFYDDPSLRSSGPPLQPSSSLHVPTLQPLNLNTERDIVNLIRHSPASGITSELIDMLFNMAQQYGMQQPHAMGSHVGRSPSQVAMNFYRSLVNGSMCASPFPCTPTSSSTNGSSSLHAFAFPPNHTSLLSANSSTGMSYTLDSAQQFAFLTSVPNSSLSFNSVYSSSSSNSRPTAITPLHRLRGLSFTPLSVDHDATGSNPITTTTENNKTSVAATSGCANESSSLPVFSSSSPPPSQTLIAKNPNR